jgi:hypothetical protein
VIAAGIAAGIAAVAVAGAAVLNAWRSESDTSDIAPCDGLPLSGTADSSWIPLPVPATQPETTVDAPDGSVGYTATDAFFRATGTGHWQDGIRTIKHSIDRPEEYHG